MTKVKICGITRLEDALYAQRAGASAIGFVFYEKSKRYIKPQDAKIICEKLKNIKKIGVFVNESTDNINEIASIIPLDYAQLHGFEKIEVCNKLNLPYIKNIRQIEELNIYDSASYFLVDANDTKNWGGTGKLGDWNLALEIKKRNKKLMLSGGLSKENILEAINTINPDVVDISSSIEDTPGIKNHSLIKTLFDKIKIQGDKNESILS